MARSAGGYRPRRAKEVPLSNRQFHIGALAVVALVALRLGLGCHFLYEGVWKIRHADEFSAKPFLTQAKGPVAPFFYAMVPDLYGRQLLHVETDADGKLKIPSDAIFARWKSIRDNFLDYYRPRDPNDEKAAAKYEELKREAERMTDLFHNRLDKYLSTNVDDIKAYFDALDRFQHDKERGQGAAFQKERRWNRMMELRQQADVWIKDIEAQETALENTLYSLLDEDQKKLGTPPAGWNPFTWGQMKLIDVAVTFGLTAIGLCLMLGLLTPLAALGGAAFMCFVVMTQPAFPGIYPPDSPILGHALLVNKDFIEMLSLLVVAAASAGRWGGLDFFLYRWCAARRRGKELGRLREKYPQEQKT